MLQENKQKQLNKDCVTPPYTDERNPVKSTKAHNRKLNPPSRNLASATCNQVASFLVYVGRFQNDRYEMLRPLRCNL